MAQEPDVHLGAIKAAGGGELAKPVLVISANDEPEPEKGEE